MKKKSKVKPKVNFKLRYKGHWLHFVIGLVLVIVGVVIVKKWTYPHLTVKAVAVITPIEQSGLTPLWKENFTDGKMDRFQYSFATGNNSALDTKLTTGMIYLGKNVGTGSDQVEQEIFNYKGDNPNWPHTIEFDVFSPQNGNGRVSIRPRVGGDFIHMNFGMSSDATKINFRFGSEPTYTYAELTGPNRGWAHVVASYEQVAGGSLQGHYVLAINDEVREYQGTSKIPDYDAYWTATPNAVEWNIESKTNETVYGRYIANLRAYQEFIPLADMQNRLAGVESYRLALADPRYYSGLSKVFQTWKTLVQLEPNALMYPLQTGPLTVEFDGSLSSAWRKITSYDWDFGDGTTGQGKVVSHDYASTGTYQVRLSVTSVDGTSAYTLPVTVSESVSPTPTPTPTATPIPTPTPTVTPTPTPTPLSMTLNPVADAYVNSNAPGKNFGATTVVQSDGSPLKISYFKFTLPLVPISSAKLRLYVTEGSTMTENIKEVSDTSWSETGINYSTKPGLGGIIGSIPSTVTGSWGEVGLTTFMAAKSGQTVAIGIDSTSNKGVGISSREGANKPVLVIF